MSWIRPRARAPCKAFSGTLFHRGLFIVDLGIPLCVVTALQWTPRASLCTIQGFMIEELDPDYNFRRGFSLGFSDDVEDKTQVLPYMRATVDPAMHKR